MNTRLVKPTVFRPMLAQKVSINQLYKLTYPKVIQPKFDGIRAIFHRGSLVSRTLKNIPNEFIQKYFLDLTKIVDIEGLDGELLVGQPGDHAVCMNTTSGVMARKGTPDFTFYVFDYVETLNRLNYQDRRSRLIARIESLPPWAKERIVRVRDYPASNASEVEDLFMRMRDDGHEGCILRDLGTLYKYGRSTLREQALLKIKPYKDTEAVIIGFEELMHNQNKPTTDVLGLTVRTSHKSGMEAGGILGAFVCKSPTFPGTIFNVGTGFTAAQRAAYWRDRESLKGKVITITYLDTGAKDSVRHPVFKHFREEMRTSDLYPSS